MKKLLTMILLIATVMTLVSMVSCGEQAQAKVVNIELTQEEYAFGVDKNQPELLEKVNAFIAKIMDDPAFASLQAVRNGRVYAIMLGDMYASTVRSIDGLRVFSAGLYPEE